LAVQEVCGTDPPLFASFPSSSLFFPFFFISEVRPPSALPFPFLSLFLLLFFYFSFFPRYRNGLLPPPSPFFFSLRNTCGTFERGRGENFRFVDSRFFSPLSFFPPLFFSLFFYTGNRAWGVFREYDERLAFMLAFSSLGLPSFSPSFSFFLFAEFKKNGSSRKIVPFSPLFPPSRFFLFFPFPPGSY